MQVASYSAKGLSAAHVTGDSSNSVRKKVQDGEFQLVYITPELLITGSVWRKMLVGEVYSERLRAFVVDEANTVKSGKFLSLLIEVNKQIDAWCSVMVVSFRGGKFSCCHGEIRRSEELDTTTCEYDGLDGYSYEGSSLKVSSTLGMVRPVVIALSPCKKQHLVQHWNICDSR